MTTMGSRVRLHGGVVAHVSVPSPSVCQLVDRWFDVRSPTSTDQVASPYVSDEKTTVVRW